MNYIKIKEWYNNVDISFEPSTLDTYAQNGRAERFRQLWIERAPIIKLSANLLHKL